MGIEKSIDNSPNRNKSEVIVLIKGAGELASAIAYRVYQNNYRVCMTELPYPLAVSRGTAFSDAVFDGIKKVMDFTAELAPLSIFEIEWVWVKNHIPIVVDPDGMVLKKLRPDVLIDARMLKKPAETKITDAKLVIGIGIGFYAGKDVHLVVESNEREGNLGRLIFQGKAEESTGLPIDIGALNKERVIWSPENGMFTTRMQIGDAVKAGQYIGKINNISLTAPLAGHLRGLLRDGVVVNRGDKLIEVDHVNEANTFFTIREKGWLIGGAVIEAIKKNVF